jgi:hypothetical protein
MIQEFVDRYMAKKDLLAATFTKHPGDYKELVKNVISVITDEDDWGQYNPDPERIHEIDDGDYQGTYVYVIAAKGYQPSNYWYVKVSYGSCSGCDTLQSIQYGPSDWDNDRPSDEQIKDYMTLALHIVQGLKEMGGGSV